MHNLTVKALLAGSVSLLLNGCAKGRTRGPGLECWPLALARGRKLSAGIRLQRMIG